MARATCAALVERRGRGLVDRGRGPARQSAILQFIASLPDEARRWDLCHALWQTADKTAVAAKRAENRRLSLAFLDKKLRRRQRTQNGEEKVWVEVLP